MITDEILYKLIASTEDPLVTLALDELRQRREFPVEAVVKFCQNSVQQFDTLAELLLSPNTHTVMRSDSKSKDWRVDPQLRILLTSSRERVKRTQELLALVDARAKELSAHEDSAEPEGEP